MLQASELGQEGEGQMLAPEGNEEPATRCIRTDDNGTVPAKVNYGVVATNPSDDLAGTERADRIRLPGQVNYKQAPLLLGITPATTIDV